MIVDTKGMYVFPVEVHRIVLDIDHQAIADYTLEHRETWPGYTTYHDQELNKEWQAGLPDREKLESCMIEAGNEYCKRTKRPLFSEYGGGHWLFYWVSVYDEGDQHDSHNHPNSLIAGTYYTNIGKGSSALTLEAPWKNHIMHDQFMNRHMTHPIQPNTGDMYLWPAWLDHRVQKQRESDKRRIAISFNLDYNKYHD